MDTYNNTKDNIARGVRAHMHICGGMGQTTSPLEVMQVAFQILEAMHPEVMASGQECRDFIQECGYDADTAKFIIPNVDDPYGIY